MKYDGLLFAILMVLLFMPIIQEWTKPFKFKPLIGVIKPTPKPVLTLESYRENNFPKQAEKHLSENFGMREPVIRFYNQYLYDFYRKSTNETVVVGKDHWVYYKNNVNDYYGTEMSHWFDSNEEAKEAFDTEARLMWKLRGVLKEYGVDFMVFMAPEKSFVYPEHLPRGDFDTSSINARDYYASQFDAYGFPYIEMTKWFIDIKAADTLSYPVFPQTGMHWNFSSVYAMDSLLRFMGDLKNRTLPKLRIGAFHKNSITTEHGDHDLEYLANLARPIPTQANQHYEADVDVVTDENTWHPNVLFVGSSFLERMYYFVPFDSLFSYSEYWYYNSTVRYGKHYGKTMPLYEKDVLKTLLESDYVVWQADGGQMYEASFGFVELALMYLCFSDETIYLRHKHLMDSLGISSHQARDTMLKHFETCFPEIAGDGIPTIRNPRISIIKNNN